MPTRFPAAPEWLRWCLPTLAPLALLAACGGGGGGVASLPTPTVTATATPTPTPTATSTPAAVFETSEYNRSGGAPYHGAITAWESGATGAGVTIGIVDSGIDTNNPEFNGRISSASSDVVAGQTRSLINPDSDHGTDVALVAAAARNGSGVLGIAWNATILMARADDAGSCTTTCNFNDVSIAAGVDRAVSNGAKVINLSLGGDPAGQVLLDAVTRAANAGVVVVVSAGNDATAQVDPFAASLRAAGNGNVIIAGSVNSSGTLSSFSDKAGTEQQWYLAALGEGICCTYQNGAIKQTVSNGQTFVELFSGTSFSAPQIAGAVALVRQAFPSMTAAQVVDLLLRTARDAGATGTDAVYGRGILDITAAFQPQGTTSLAGTTTQVTAAAVASTTSAAMGDAAATASVPAVMLDMYGRAFHTDLAAGLRPAMPALRLAPALTAMTASTSAGSDRLSLAITVDGAARLAGLRWSGPLHLSGEQDNVARALAARMVASLSPATRLGFAYAQGSDGLAADLQGQSRPAFLIAPDPLADTGFQRRPGMAFAVRHQLGRWGVTASAESARTLDATQLPGQPDSPYAADRFALALDRRVAGLDTMIGLSLLAEDRTVLGARFNPAFGISGARTMLLDAAIGWQPGPQWRLAAAWRQAWTAIRGGGLMVPNAGLASNAWAFDVSRSGLFSPQSVLAFRVAQPLRVSSGGLELSVPVAWDYASATASDGLRTIGLAPRGRELDGELAIATPLARGRINASLFWRHAPGNRADLPDDHGLGVAWKAGF